MPKYRVKDYNFFENRNMIGKILSAIWSFAIEICKSIEALFFSEAVSSFSRWFMNINEIYDSTCLKIYGIY